MDVGDPHTGRERGADRLAGDDRPGARELRQRDITRRASLVNFFLGRCLGLPQDLEARQGRGREVGLGLLGLELGFLDGDIEGDEYRAGVHDAPGREHHLADRARELVAQGDRIQREDRSD